eukprot:scaffold320972_cov14-Tisochrysis_lutea.AAC.1
MDGLVVHNCLAKESCTQFRLHDSLAKGFVNTSVMLQATVSAFLLVFIKFVTSPVFFLYGRANNGDAGRADCVVYMLHWQADERAQQGVIGS